MKYILISLTLGLAMACGPTPRAAQAVPEGPSVLALSSDPCTTPACRWTDLGPQPLNAAPSFVGSASLTVAQNLPVVAWDEGVEGSNALIRVKTGPTWEAPTRLNGVEEGFSPALAQAALNTLAPVVAFSERRDARNDAVIRLKTRTVVNGAWVWTPLDPVSDAGLGGFDAPGSVALHPSVVSIPNFTFVAWEELAPDGEFRIFARSLRNGVWQNLGTAADGSVDRGSFPRLSVNPNNRMALTYFQDSPLGGRAVVRRWGGSTFDPVPDPSALGVDLAALGIASTGEPIVALPEFQAGVDAAPNLVVRQRTGHGTWQQLGTPLNVNPAARIDTVSVAVSGEQISVAWQESVGDVDIQHTLLAKRWNAATQTWVPLGGAISTDPTLSVSALALLPDGRPLVALDRGTEAFGPVKLLVQAFGLPGGAP